LSDLGSLLPLAFAAGCLAIVAAVIVDRGIRRTSFPMSALLWSRGVLPVFIGLTFAFEFFEIEAITWLGRLSTLLAALGLVAAFVLVRRGDLRLSGARSFAIGAGAFVGGAFVSDIAAGSVTAQTMFVGVGYMTTYLAVVTPGWLLPRATHIAGLYVAASASAAVLAPNAWSPYPETLLGITERLHGVFFHANGLGPMMALYLVLMYANGTRRTRLMWFLGAVALVLLVLSQSKTAWAAALAAGVVLWLGRSKRNAAVRILAVTLVAVAAVSVALLTESQAEFEVLEQQDVESLRTLTGRTALWQYGLDAWRESPVFGGGPMVFRDYAQRMDQAWAGQAHNQYVQTLGRHGVVGLAGLMVLLAVLLGQALRLASHTRYVSLALVALLLVRSLTEANIDSFSYEPFIIFALLLAWERERKEAVRTGTDLETSGIAALKEQAG
jgi:exopolysaccharide production protein ExoQ